LKIIMNIINKSALKSTILYIHLFLCAFTLNIFNDAYAEQPYSGIERLKAGIESYENGSYEEAIFKLEIALIELPQGDKENIWEAHFYLGMSHYLLGEDVEARKEFIKAKEIFKNRLPDPDMHSPKIIKIYEESTKLKIQEIEGMVFVNDGCFEMGDTFGDGKKDEKPVHEVCVDDFYMGQCEVTQGQWEDVMGSNPSKFKNGRNFPVEKVSWNDVRKFIKKLNQKTGENYRLPTEAEWEYAARSGGKKEKYAGFSGESELYLYANVCDKNCEYGWKTKGQNDGYENTAPVGSYKPNGLGLYDMTGNVYEWCSDWYGNDYYSNSPRKNPQGASSGSYRVGRGGSGGSGPRSVRASGRGGSYPDDRDSDLGFRLSRTP